MSPDLETESPEGYSLPLQLRFISCFQVLSEEQLAAHRRVHGRKMQDSTTRAAGSSRGSRGEEAPRRVPVLTVLAHPLPSRIGQRAVLNALAAGGAIELSRRSPSFSPADSLWDQEPLDDPFLSRKPWHLERPSIGSFVLRRAGSPMALRVDGEDAGEEVEISRQRLDEGVVLELAGRITLLFHLVSDPLPPRPDLQADLVGGSEGLRQVHQAIARVAHLAVPVLVRGETGTGKELVARALHRHGRPGKPFVAVSLGALSPSLAAAELFGHVKGAYTGAADARPGLFRAADGGTLFLDEVGEAPGEVQAMLLRVLETRQILPVGAQKPVTVDVRLVAATDASLEELAERGGFRVPLLHRLAAYEIWLPPLRARRDDLGQLFLHFAREAAEQMGTADTLDRRDPGAPAWLPSELMARLARYPWPGNARQLRNVVHQLMIDAQGHDPLRAGLRLDRLLATTGSHDIRPSETGPTEAGPARDTARRVPADVTPEQLETTLREHRFEPAAAARQLGISRPSIYRLIREHPRLRIAEDLDAEEVRHALRQAEGVVRLAAERLEVSSRALGRRVHRDGLG